MALAFLPIPHHSPPLPFHRHLFSSSSSSRSLIICLIHNMENYRTLEVKLISAKNLKQEVSNPFSSKMNVYAIVHISNDPKYEKLKERTRRDRTGGCNPAWNSTFRFVVPAVDVRGTTTGGGLSLRIVLRTGHGIVDRDVGEVTVPLSELLASSSSSSSSVAGDDDSFTVSKCVTYQVRKTDSDSDGGVVNLSYRFLRITDTLKPRTGMTEYNPAQTVLGPGTSTKTKVAAFVGALFTGPNAI